MSKKMSPESLALTETNKKIVHNPELEQSKFKDSKSLNLRFESPNTSQILVVNSQNNILSSPVVVKKCKILGKQAAGDLSSGFSEEESSVKGPPELAFKDFSLDTPGAGLLFQDSVNSFEPILSYLQLQKQTFDQ